MSSADLSLTPTRDPGADLDAMRVEIDRIDASMHALLIERSEIIDRLIAIKIRQGGGSAFRPGREAEMMRRLVARHRGRLPLDTVESIWRIIISTFTYVQARYAVHADMAAGDAAMRDCARFHFGFTVPLTCHFGSDGVIAAVAAADGDLGLVPVASQASGSAWWRALAAPDAPKIIARLPFVERPDHPAGMPVFVVARSVAATAAREVVLVALELDQWRDAVPVALARLGCASVGHAAREGHVSLLVEAPGQLVAAELVDALREIVDVRSYAEAGSHASRFELA